MFAGSTPEQGSHERIEHGQRCNNNNNNMGFRQGGEQNKKKT
jgi:hypothetical protein